MKRIFVFVYLPGETLATPAGVFDYDEKLKTGLFQYGKKYLANSASQPASPVELPIDNRRFFTAENNGLFSVFRDASPDYWGRTVLSASLNKTIDELDDYEYLLHGGGSRTGNLDFRLSVNSPEPLLELPSHAYLDDLLDAAERTQNGLPIDESLRLLLNQGSSGIGGMRPKCTVSDENNVLWLAKFPDKTDSHNAVLTEYATMSLAAKAGIDVPALKILTVASKSILLIERFDRRYLEEKKGYARRGFLSSLSLLQKHETDRDFGYPEIAEKLRLLGAEQDAKALFSRMIFNIACRNTDDHARNHGFLVNGSAISLSPAYDINATRSTPGVSTDYYLALKAGDNGSLANLSNALSQCARFGLTHDDALARVAIIHTALASWREVFSSCGVIDHECDLFENTFAVSLERFSDFLSSQSDSSDMGW